MEEYSFRDRVAQTNPIPIYWWRPANPDRVNLGDELTAPILEGVFGVSCVRAEADSAVAIGAGSILPSAYSSRNRHEVGSPIGVLGSGLINSRVQMLPNDDVKLYGVRGYFTQSCIDSANVDAVGVGDVGLLAGLLEQRQTFDGPEYDVGLIPHISHYSREWIEAHSNNLNSVRVLDIRTSDLRQFIADMRSCRVIVSESLHGLIIADSIGMPNVWLSDSELSPPGSGRFKFYDYFSTVARPFGMRISDQSDLTLRQIMRQAFLLPRGELVAAQGLVSGYLYRFFQEFGIAHRTVGRW